MAKRQIKKSAVNSGKNSGKNSGNRDATGKFIKGNSYAWQSGQSGNPKGRPTNGDMLAEFIQSIGTESIEGTELSRLYAMVRLMFGSKNANDHIELLNRIGGKVADKIEIEEPITIKLDQ